MIGHHFSPIEPPIDSPSFATAAVHRTTGGQVIGNLGVADIDSRLEAPWSKAASARDEWWRW